MFHPRPTPPPHDVLHLFVPTSQWSRLELQLVAEQGAQRIPAAAPDVFFAHIVGRFAVMNTPKRNIHIWEVCDETALGAIVYAGQTGKINFISGNTLGCAYPPVTLAGITLWGYAGYLSVSKNSSLFWQELGFTALYDVTRDPHTGCLRSEMLCLGQVRSFSDRGALTLQFGRELTEDDVNNITMPWRLSTRSGCSRGCIHEDPMW